MALTVRATVPGVSAEEFTKAAEAAKTGCPAVTRWIGGSPGDHAHTATCTASRASANS